MIQGHQKYNAPSILSTFQSPTAQGSVHSLSFIARAAVVRASQSCAPKEGEKRDSEEGVFPATNHKMKGAKGSRWCGQYGGYTEQHPMWKKAYKFRILKLAGVKEEDEEGGYEDLRSLIERYIKWQKDPSKINDLECFNAWNMERVYQKNKISTTKQKLRKKLTDLKRERREKYEETIKEIIDEYIVYMNDLENQEEKEEEDSNA